MIITEIVQLVGTPNSLQSNVINEIKKAIESAKIIIPPIKKGNGVKPIKEDVMLHLDENGWSREHGMNLEGMRAKPLDSFKQFENARVGFEWETGNISSTFRALMKIFKGLIEEQLDIGVLVLPNREFYQYLTDRVGNMRELKPYLSVYQRIQVPKNKRVIILAVQYDGLDENASAIPKGTDGRARV